MTTRISVPMWDKMQFFCKRIADHQIRLVLHFKEILNERLLKDAIIMTLERNPIAFAQYEESKKEAYWNYFKIDIDKIYSFQECKTSEQLLKSTLLRELDTINGPQLTISLIRSATDILVLNCNHVITDAAGVKDFIYEIANKYTHLSLSLKNGRQLLENAPSRSLKLFLKQLNVKNKISILKAMLSIKQSAPSFNRNIDSGCLQNPDFKTFTFSSDEFQALKDYGKRHGATVNDMLLAVYFLTLKRLLSNSNNTNRLTYSSDLRPYLKHGDYDILSNFSTIHNIDVDNTKNNFKDILKGISTQTKLRKQVRYNFANFPMIALLIKTLPYQKCKKMLYKEFDKIKEGKSNAAPILSNVGIINDKRITFNAITPSHAYMLGGINHPSLLQLVASTYQNQLTISVGSYFNEKNMAFVSMFFYEFRKVLEKKVLTHSEIYIV